MRLLAFPDVSRWWLERIFPQQGRIMDAARPLARAVLDVSLPGDAVLDQIGALARGLIGGLGVVLVVAGALRGVLTLATAGVVLAGITGPPLYLGALATIGVSRFIQAGLSAALPHVTARRGYVMIISSTAAFTMMPGMAAYAASKAAVEQFANCLRLEVAHKGVKVGSVHPGWIDTDLVRDSEKDLQAFAEARSRLPWPVRSTTSVEACAKAIVNGAEKRRDRIFVPRSARVIYWARNVLNSTVGERVMIRDAEELVPRMDAEVAALGRSMSARVVELNAAGADLEPTGDAAEAEAGPGSGSEAEVR